MPCKAAPVKKLSRQEQSGLERTVQPASSEWNRIQKKRITEWDRIKKKKDSLCFAQYVTKKENALGTHRDRTDEKQ